MRRLALTLLLPALAACGAGDRARTAVSDSSGEARVEPGSVAGAVALELWQLRPGLTAGEWTVAHPDEAISGDDSSAATRHLGDWCAAAQRVIPVGERRLTRTAFFYPPRPTDLALPDSVPDLARRCELGLVWLRVDYPGTSDANAAGDSLAELLGAAYGGPVASPVRFFGSAHWHRVARYRRGETTVVSGARTEGPARIVFTFAFLPIAGISVDSGPIRRWAPVDTFPLDSATRLAGSDTTLSGTLRALASSPRDTAYRQPMALVQPLLRWLTATAGLPAPRRAAALYLADRVLDAGMCAYGLCDDGGRAERAGLEAAGARFTRSAPAGAWVYERTWLNQARMLDRDSPLGQRVLLTQLAHAFDFSGSCREGSEGFRRVIANAERYLARVPDSPVAAEVHFELAEAYRDIVGLARGAGGNDADSSRYGEEAGAAAAQMMEHYRAAMAAGPGSPVARAAWQRAWWLKAGLVPRDLRFYCI